MDQYDIPTCARTSFVVTTLSLRRRAHDTRWVTCAGRANRRTAFMRLGGSDVHTAYLGRL